MTTLLQLHDVHKAFGGNQVLTGLDFSVEAGEIVGLLGPNGCGKSTVLNAITGYCPIDAGQIGVNGQRVSGLAPHQVAARGIRRTFQFPSMPTRMTVKEAAIAGLTRHHGLLGTLFGTRATRESEREARQRADELLAQLLLDKVANQPAAAISGGQKKLLGIACALMEQPTLLLLDEPMAGVHPNLRTELVQRLKDINQQGVTLVIIEHDMHFIAETCGRCVVLDKGRAVANCTPAELERNQNVVEAYLGKGTSSNRRTAGAVV